MNEEAIKMFEEIRNNNLPEAQICFENSLKKSQSTNHIEELAEFADTLHQAGFLDQAMDAYILLKKMTPDLEEWDLLLAEIYIDQNKVETALDLLLQFEKSSELYPHALLMLADAYQTMGLFEVSEHKIQEAIKILPKEPVLQYALGKLYHTSGDYKKAITIYRSLIKEDTQELWAENLYLLLADCENAVGMFEEAVDSLEKVPDNEHTPDSLFQLGFAYQQLKEFHRASQIYEDLLEKDPHYMSAYLYLAEVLEEELRVDEALIAIKKGIDLNPYQAEYYLTAAKLLLKSKVIEEKPEEYLNHAIQLEPDLTEAILLKADVLLSEERYKEVILLLSDESMIPQPQYEWQLAKAYNELEVFDKASVHFDKAYLDLSDNISFLEEYIIFLQEEGDTTKLLSVLEVALILDPENEFFFELKEKFIHDDL